MIHVLLPHLPLLFLTILDPCCSVALLCLTLCDSMDFSTPGFPVLHYLLEFAQTHVHWVGDAIQPSHPLLPSSPLAFNLSQVFSNKLALCIRKPKYWSFSFSISPSNAYSGLIFFRMDWLDILEVQRTLRSLLQHPSLKASIFWPSILDLCSEWNSTSECPRTASSNWKQRAHDLLFVGVYLLASH